ncbi:MAG: PSD1 and planctomycete cytochrome C domain-containing protein [Verrucomicrobiota bacterium]
MNRRIPKLYGSVLLLFSTAVAVQAREIDFNRDIRPILSNKCFACHGFDEHERKADLRLDTREGAFEDLGGYSAIVPGDIDESEAWYRIITDDEIDLMPPPKFHKPMTDEEKDLIRAWIEQGAEYDVHWSYKPLQKDESVSDTDLIDHHIDSEIAKAGLIPVDRADPVTLVRRLHFDLLGLPATPERIARFVANSSPQAWERLVDELLADPGFGERLAVYWLDLVRYADTIGYHSDAHMEVSAYRDYVIDAFNQNLPYDQFTVEQLAGDLLPEPTTRQRIASGYNRLLQTTEEGGAQGREYMAIYAADRVRNASTVWLGSTIGCAQCHDHKFDPFTAKDFYAFAAFFADVKEKSIGRRQPNLMLPTEAQEIRSAELQQAASDSKIEAVLRRDEELQSLVDSGFIAWEQITGARLRGEAEPDDWRTATALSWETTENVQLKQQPDGALIAAKARPENPEYQIRLRAEGALTAIRLEALRDDAFPNKGLSWGNGNFVLTDFSISKNGEPLKLTEAEASFEQNNFPIGAAIDEDPATGWAVSGHTDAAADQQAIFHFATPIHLGAEDELLVVMKHQSRYPAHHVSRFRLSVTEAPTPGLGEIAEDLPEEITKILLQDPSQRSDSDKSTIRTHFEETTPLLAKYREAEQAAAEAREAHEKSIRTTLVSESLSEPRMTRLLHRGDWMDETGEIVQPALPAFLPKDADLPSERRGNRLDLAQWIVGDSNPLTARTWVNRLWMLYFGEGLSRNVEDLGAQGEPPTHPELLDQLSIRFQENGWDVKALVKTMVLSEAYQRSSTPTEEQLEQDPTNQTFARQERWRVEAEFVRDTALELAGLLVDETTGGTSVKPYQPAGYWQHLNFPKRTWQAGKGEDLYRRGVYTFWCRSFLHPAKLAFDAPTREECTAQRSRSNIPQQALVMLNDPSFVEAARKFGDRILAAEGNTEAKIRFGWREATGRAAEPAEVNVLKEVYQLQLGEYLANPEAAGELATVGESPSSTGAEPAKRAAWTQVARTILNAYETTARN